MSTQRAAERKRFYDAMRVAVAIGLFGFSTAAAVYAGQTLGDSDTYGGNIALPVFVGGIVTAIGMALVILITVTVSSKSTEVTACAMMSRRPWKEN